MVFLRYWYLGPLKTKVAHFFSTLKVNTVYNVEAWPLVFCCSSVMCVFGILKNFLLQMYMACSNTKVGHIYLYTNAESIPVVIPLIYQLTFSITKPIFNFILVFYFPLSIHSLTLTRQTLNTMTCISLTICKCVYISIWKWIEVLYLNISHHIGLCII